MNQKEIKTMEKWKSVQDYYGYEVSNLGNIRSFHTGEIKPVKTFINNVTGYVICHLSSPGMKRITKNLHILVARAFIENPHNYNSIDHKNSDKRDNSVWNLRYMPHKINCQRATSKPVELENVQTGEKRIFMNTKKAGEYLGVDANSIRSAASTLKTRNRKRVTRGHYSSYIDLPPDFFIGGVFDNVILKD